MTGCLTTIRSYDSLRMGACLEVLAGECSYHIILTKDQYTCFIWDGCPLLPSSGGMHIEQWGRKRILDYPDRSAKSTLVIRYRSQIALTSRMGVYGPMICDVFCQFPYSTMDSDFQLHDLLNDPMICHNECHKMVVKLGLGTWCLDLWPSRLIPKIPI